MTDIKKITVFGSTGTVGLFILEQTLVEGLDITVLLRDPSKLPSKFEGKVNVVEGNVLDRSKVEEAVAGAQGVIVVLGTRNALGPTTEMSTGVNNILAAMKKHGVKPVSVCLSSFLFMPADKVPAMFNEINLEHSKMLKALEESDRDYIAVFPPHFGDNPRGEYLVKHDALPGGRVVAKPDLADFFIKSLSQSDHYRKKVGISSVLKTA